MWWYIQRIRHGCVKTEGTVTPEEGRNAKIEREREKERYCCSSIYKSSHWAVVFCCGPEEEETNTGLSSYKMIIQEIEQCLVIFFTVVPKIKKWMNWNHKYTHRSSCSVDAFIGALGIISCLKWYMNEVCF